MILQISTEDKSKMKVLILCEEDDENERSAQTLVDITMEEVNKVQPFQPFKNLYIPNPPIKHTIIVIPTKIVHGITDELIKIESKYIIGDYKRRQNPRFR